MTKWGDAVMMLSRKKEDAQKGRVLMMKKKQTSSPVPKQPRRLFTHMECREMAVAEQLCLQPSVHTSELYCTKCKKRVGFDEIVEQMAYRLMKLIDSGMKERDAKLLLAQQYRTEKQAEATRQGKRIA